MKPYLVVLLGPDGCGKTTIADRLQKSLLEQRLRVIRQHWRPGVLPSPRVLLGQKPSGDPSMPHATPPHPTYISVGLSLYYWIDFWLGRARDLVGFGSPADVALCERYVYDVVLDPTRHRLDVPHQWRVLFTKTSPTPALLVVLDGDAHKIVSRKAELSVAEVNAQMNRIRTDIDASCPRLILDTTRLSPQQIVGRILEEMSSVLPSIRSN